MRKHVPMLYFCESGKLRSADQVIYTKENVRICRLSMIFSKIDKGQTMGLIKIFYFKFMFIQQ